MQNSTTWFIVLGSAALVVLLALTMRSVIRRDRAMIDDTKDEPRKSAAYQERWRKGA